MLCDWARRYQYRRIINDALHAPPSQRQRTTNLYLDTVPHEKGSFIGPAFQEIRARQRCLLVFADDDPLANFGHPCRYRFYDEKTHAFLYEVSARFPPYLRFVPSTFRVFHESVRVTRTRLRTPLEIVPTPTPTPTPTPVPAPVARERYAILFSGSSERRHLNDLEYCYRMLTTRYQFKAANICVLNFDNTRSLKEGVVANNWPDETSASDPYQIPIAPLPAPPPSPLPGQPLLSAKADRAGFQLACQLIAAKLQPQDLVFIHTNGHGDALPPGSQPQDAWLVQHDELLYLARDFCTDLAALPAHESLLILMQQCCSGQFIGPVIAARGAAVDPIKASRLSIACASKVSSYSTADFNFDQFALGWITAHLDKDPYGFPPRSVVDTGGGPGPGGNGFIEASEAYVYAASVAHPQDRPAFADAPAVASATTVIATPAAGDIRLN
jgi:hypothetical protein